MKTPIKELIEGLETLNETQFSKNNIIAHISLYLEKEKQVIIEAFESQRYKAMGHGTGEQYYAETFKK